MTPYPLAVSDLLVRRALGLCVVIGVGEHLAMLILVPSRLLLLGMSLREALVSLLVVCMWMMVMFCPLGVLLSLRALPVCRMTRRWSSPVGVSVLTSMEDVDALTPFLLQGIIPSKG